MTDFLQSIVAILVIGIIIAIINKPIRNLLKKIVCSGPVSKLVLKILIWAAEHKRAFKPPGSGPQKKEWVKQKYDRWVDKSDDAVDACIDFIVAAFNSRKSAYTATAKTQLSGLTKEAFDSAFTAIEEAAANTDDGNETTLTSDSDTSADAVG